MPSFLKSIILLASLLGSNAVLVPCRHEEGQTLLHQPDENTPWILASYPQASCGGTAAPSSGKGEQGCNDFSKSATPYLSYRYWGVGTLKACFYSQAGCAPGTLIDASTGDHEMSCFAFADFDEAISYSIISATSPCSE